MFEKQLFGSEKRLSNFAFMFLSLSNLENFQTVAKILSYNSVGAKLFFLGCNRNNNHGSNFIIKKENLLGSTRKGN